MNNIKKRSINDIVAWAAEMQEKGRQRPDERRDNPPLPNNTGQIPIWPHTVRGVPNAALRSALFGAIRKGPRAYLERQEIHSQNGIRIMYTGARLDQGDLDVWETVLHIQRLQGLENECRVTAYQFLKLLEKTDTGKNRSALNLRLSRMKATGVDVKMGKFSYEGSLIDEVYRAEESREYIIRLNPKLSALFANDQFTHVDWNVRHALNGKPLAQWLHGFYASHAKPFPMNMTTLLTLSGSENNDPYSAQQKLHKALDAVTDASSANDQAFSYAIKGDLVHVKKEPSKTQQRHLGLRQDGQPTRLRQRKP